MESKLKNIKKIKDSMKLKEKNPHIESTVKEDLNRILNTFKQNGFYFVKIDTKIEKNQNDTVNIIFDVDQGIKQPLTRLNLLAIKSSKMKTQV